MPFNTITVGGAVTPTVIETYFSHYLHRKPLRHKPTAHISYHEGLRLIRRFLAFASVHTVEELQAFTQQWVPNPRWVKTEEVIIPQEHMEESARLLQSQLGPEGLHKVGGKQWWQWRRNNSPLKAEWVEMRSDFEARKRSGKQGNRVMLYVHGGAYYFGTACAEAEGKSTGTASLEARNEIQRLTLNREHEARYHLAPQYPFPCGLHDCLAAYISLLTEYDPSMILMGGDSAGAGMIVSILVTLRDQGLPPPAGAILISPWVDLTHSFPSVAGDSPLDYVPAHGFLHKPSTSWPPPNCDDMRELEDHARGQRHGNAERPSHGHISLDEKVAKPETSSHAESAISGAAAPSLSNEPSIILDGEMIRIKDQIQIYTTNELVSHPLVSPILQPSLGGLPPLLVMTGGGEMLRDEQIYLAHKAANPPKYPPSETCLNENLQARETLARYQGTDVQLQVWEDLCHVAPTLSFTRPAKYMYRSIAQFGAWALARAQKTEIEIMYDDDDDISIISSGSESDAASATSAWKTRTAPALSSIQQQESITQIGKAGDPLPAFRNHMLRERVDRHGHIFPLAAPSELPALQLAPSEIGMIKEGPVRKWMHAKREWDIKFAREKRQVQKQRAKELAAGYELFGDGERPPPSALAARRRKDMPKEEKVKRSWGMSLWSLWGSSHDREILEREEKAHREPAKVLITPSHGGANEPPSKRAADRSRSRRRTVTDMGQTEHQSTEVLASALVPVESDTKHSKVGGSTSGVVSTSTKVEQ